MLRREVYRPIGIRYAPSNSTIEPGNPRAAGHPLLAYGYYPTVDDLARLGGLFAHPAGGRATRSSPGGSSTGCFPDRPQRQRRSPSPTTRATTTWTTGTYAGSGPTRAARGSCRRCSAGVATVTVAGADTTLIRIRNNWVGDKVSAQRSINGLADALWPTAAEHGSYRRR